MSAMIFQSVTLLLVIYLVIWTYEIKSSYIDHTKDLNLGDCIKIGGQLYRIDTIEISISADSRADISAFKVEEGE